MSSINKRLALALSVSLMANLFFAGFAVARVMYGHPGHGGRERSGHADFRGPFLGPAGLFREGPGRPPAALVRRVMERDGKALRAQRTRLRAAKSTVHAALTTEPFDGSALEHSLGDLRASTAESQRLMHVALVELAQSLTPEQRRGLATKVRGPERAGGPRRHGPR